MCAESNLCDSADIYLNCQLNLFPMCLALILNKVLNIQTVSKPKAEIAASLYLSERSQPLEKVVLSFPGRNLVNATICWSLTETEQEEKEEVSMATSDEMIG